MHNYTSYTDEQLVLLLRDGDESAFTEIYNRYWQKLLFVAHKRIHSAEDAKEIVQNVFLLLWKKRSTININVLPVYLSAMVRHAVYRFWAGADQKIKSLITNDEPQYHTEQDIDNRQLIDILAKFADTLPEKYRIIFISHKILDQPLEEVAAQLGVSPRTAERYVSKVLEIMRTRLDKVALSATQLDFLIQLVYSVFP